MGRPVFHVILFFAIAVAGAVADLWTKSAVFQALGMPGEYRQETPEIQSTYWLWDGVFGFQTSLNQGALFGMGQGRSAMFAVFSVIALVGILIWLFHSARKSLLLSCTLGLIVAGIIGNFYDRMGWHGLVWNYPDALHKVGEPVFAVRDWILVMFGSYPYPNFNIADSMLVCGAILLFLHSILEPSKKTTPPADSVNRRA
jgi:signal peptidase II